MEEWKIFLTIGEILALFFLVGKPILKLNGTLTKISLQMQQVNERLDTQRKDINAMRKDAEKSHEEIWRHEDAQDQKLHDHEIRLVKIEQRK